MKARQDDLNRYQEEKASLERRHAREEKEMAVKFAREQARQAAEAEAKAV